MKKLLKLSSALAIVVGIILVIGGIWGICFTYNAISEEKIVTPEDASISSRPVRGPLTLKAQANVIRKHVLGMTGGKTYAEMPRQVTKVDQNGLAVLDGQGKPVMVPNSTRDLWVTATTLTTALNLGIFSYVFSALIILFGLVFIWNGIILYILSKHRSFT